MKANATNSLSLSRTDGFSLLEMLLAMFVMTIVALGLAGMEITVDSELDEATLRTAATLAADQQMEALLATDYDLLVSNKERWTLLENREAIAAWEVTSDQPLAGMKTIALTVFYVAGGPREVTLNTTIRK
jgi:prepilin-type N-terminal cleavage/methylation domain-containing protein